MPVAAFTPSRIHTDYAEWTAPGIAYNGQVWAWNNTTGKYEPTALAFDPAGTAAAAISTHLAASNPHSQYLLASGVSAFGATLIDDADASAGRTTLGLGTSATLNVGTSANNIVQLNGSAQLPAVSGALLTNLPAGSAAGSTTQVQYNSAGSFAGDAGMTYDAASDRLTVAGGLIAPSMRPASDSTTALQLQNAAGTSVVTVDTTNSRIGIGGTPTSARLEVSATSGQDVAYFIAASSGTGFFVKAGSGSVASIFSGFIDSANFTVASLSVSAIDHGAHTANFDFSTRVSGTLTTTMRLSAAGLVGIGTSTGTISAKLHLLDSVGNYHLRIENGATGGGYWHIAQADNSFGSGGGKLLFLPDSNVSTNAKIVFTNAGYVGIGTTTPTALLDIAASTTSRASLRIRSGTAPTSPNDGDVWFDGTDFKCRIGGVTKTFTVT